MSRKYPALKRLHQISAPNVGYKDHIERRNSRNESNLPTAAVFIWHNNRVSSNQNAIQGDFGEAWLEAVASGCGLLRGRSTLDLEKADVQLTYPGSIEGSYCPSVKVQVKTQVNLETDPDNGNLVYNLDVQTYDFLRREDHVVRRILVVIGLIAAGPRIRLHQEGTLLVGRGAWVSLEGRPPTSNTKSQVIQLPAQNTHDEPGLRSMLGIYGVRRTSKAADFDPWEDPKREMEGER